MTWKELKTAIEKTEIRDDDEIWMIECTYGQGDKTLRVMRLGRALKLIESPSDEVSDHSGCAT
jgi:hypothetical protein